MKSKIILVVFFFSFLTFTGFAKTYKVIAVRGTVTLIYGGQSITLSARKKFNATIAPSELLFVTAGSITFAETIRGAQPQTASCSSANCQPNTFFMGNVVVGTHRDELDAFLLNDNALLNLSLANSIHNAGLQLIKQTPRVPSRINKMDRDKAAPQAVPQHLPQMNKAAQKQR